MDFKGHHIKLFHFTAEKNEACKSYVTYFMSRHKWLAGSGLEPMKWISSPLLLPLQPIPILPQMTIQNLKKHPL